MKGESYALGKIRLELKETQLLFLLGREGRRGGEGPRLLPGEKRAAVRHLLLPQVKKERVLAAYRSYEC